ncbi:Asr1405/Asl0597 family protein [Anabaenopsis elenkinii]|jgi:hypothetical protein|uniref:Uncharacterized protein n=1 Tax=Anabaenopsis elenkinii CCIBt3563 TaxID=2779889 RepID=A0A7S6RCB9_9CYAN|nr:Asr1405/Asl0597 family protein [Anabaenopsis elenkinii]QOV22341.1 hypothetical protein IM676_16945 [Anabaenopsis elenkinii CCIBt3563]
MLTPHSSDFPNHQVLQIPLSVRWPILLRLQELMIPCCCHSDGSVEVQVNNLLEAILIRSILMQFLASRYELVDWLERCWDTDNC